MLRGWYSLQKDTRTESASFSGGLTLIDNKSWYPSRLSTNYGLLASTNSWNSVPMPGSVLRFQDIEKEDESQIDAVRLIVNDWPVSEALEDAR